MGAEVKGEIIKTPTKPCKRHRWVLVSILSASVGIECCRKCGAERKAIR